MVNFALNLDWQSVDVILEDVSVTETKMFDAKLLISRNSSFSVSKISVVRYV